MEISINQAAKMAGVVEKTIRLWIRKSNFKHRKAVNQRVWIDKESFETFIESKLEKTSEDADDIEKIVRSIYKKSEDGQIDGKEVAEGIIEILKNRRKVSE